MRQFKLALFSFSLLFFVGLISSCNGNGKTKTEMKEGKEYASKYICPMHCEGSGSDKDGTCPDCKMKYRKNENYKPSTSKPTGQDHGDHDDHSGHDHSHEGHNH